MRIFIFFIFFTMPCYLAAQAQKVPREAYGKLPEKSMVIISPNAERMAYIPVTIQSA